LTKVAHCKKKKNLEKFPKRSGKTVALTGTENFLNLYGMETDKSESFLFLSGKLKKKKTEVNKYDLGSDRV